MTPFHHIGDFVRELVISIPMPMAKGFFIVFLLALIVWVALLPRERYLPDEESAGKGGIASNLKVWALVALVLQVVIYMVF